jgi:hypothetical protein
VLSKVESRIATAQQILNGEAVSSLSSKYKMNGGSRGFKSSPLVFLIMFGIVNDSDTTSEFQFGGFGNASA